MKKEQALQELYTAYQSLLQLTKKQPAIWKHLDDNAQKAILDAKDILKGQKVSTASSASDDVCSNLSRVYPSVVGTSHSDYKDHYKTLTKEIFKHNDGASVYNKIKEKNIYFLPVYNKEAFYSDNLRNIKPCRFNEVKSYSFICLVGSDNFKTMELYTIDGTLVKKLVQTEKLFEEQIDEAEEAIEETTCDFGLVDFYVSNIFMKDEKGEVIASRNYDPPTIEAGVYTRFRKTPFRQTFIDKRKGYNYKYRTNYPTKRPTTLEVIGSQGEKKTKKITLEGMTKKVIVKVQHQHTIDQLDINTDLADHDKWFLDGHIQASRPSLTGELTFGAGMQAKTYEIYLADSEGNESKPQKVTKRSKNGYIAVTIKLGGDSGTKHWNMEDILKTIQDEEQRIMNYLMTELLTEVLELMKQFNNSPNLDPYDEVHNMVDTFSDVIGAIESLGENIPFLGGICSAIKSITTNVTRMKAMVEARRLYHQREAFIEELNAAIASLNKYNKTIGNNTNQYQQVLTYYENKTQGNATTQMICSDITLRYNEICDAPSSN